MTEEYSSYRGNTNLKRANTQIQYTPEQIQEYVKCADDPIYFIKTYVKIIHVDHGLVPFSLWDFQETMIRMMIEDRYTIYCMPRQIGKCVQANTNIRVRNKKTGEISEISAKDFHEKIKNR